MLLAHLSATLSKLLGPGGARAVVAESMLMKQQLLVINRSRRRAPNLSALDRLLVPVSRATADLAGRRHHPTIDAAQVSRRA